MYSGTDAVVDVILSIGFLLSIWGVWIALSGKSMVKGQQLTATQARTQAAFLIAPTAVNFYVTFAGLRGVLGPVVAVLVVVCFVAQIVYTNRAVGDVTLDLFDDLTPAAQQPDPQPATSPISRPDSSPSAPSAAQVPAPAWCPDPTGRHSLRYWDGAIWTHHVATDGRQSVDPLDAGPVPDGRGPAVAGQPEGPIGGIVEQDAGDRTMLPSSLRPLLDEAQSAYGVWTSLDRDDFFSKDRVPVAESAMQQVLERFVAGAITAGMAPDDVFAALRRRFPGAVGHDFFERTVSSEAEFRTAQAARAETNRNTAQGRRSSVREPAGGGLESRYASMSTEEFALLEREDLTAEGRSAYDREVERRSSPEWAAQQAWEDDEIAVLQRAAEESYWGPNRSVRTLALWGAVNLGFGLLVSAQNQTVLDGLQTPGFGIYFLLYSGLVLGAVMLAFAAFGLVKSGPEIVFIEGLMLIVIGVFNMSHEFLASAALSTYGYAFSISSSLWWAAIGLAQVVWGARRLAWWRRMKTAAVAVTSDSEIDPVPPAWHPDPTARHALRYWDGTSWTGHVTDGERQRYDPLPEAASRIQEVETNTHAGAPSSASPASPHENIDVIPTQGGSPTQEAAPPPPAWHPDPTARHALRYWDGTSWTGHVADGECQQYDPILAPAPECRGAGSR
ncbi:MAG: DUF2510 domain-containing protein [Actinomycetota bacterium]|nr:DUF2510 domain-containing protein [Actinomycetota bacterium]